MHEDAHALRGQATGWMEESNGWEEPSSQRRELTEAPCRWLLTKEG